MEMNKAERCLSESELYEWFNNLSEQKKAFIDENVVGLKISIMAQDIEQFEPAVASFLRNRI